MPSTAAERFLLDPLDPARVLPKSAEFLRELPAPADGLGHLLFFLLRRRKCIADEAINRALDSNLIVPPFRLQEPSVNKCVNFRYV
jgi:hypothetical protein